MARRYRCLLCNRVFGTFSTLVMHLRNAHRNFNGKCPCCGREFTRWNAFKTHVAKSAEKDACHAALYIANSMGKYAHGEERERVKTIYAVLEAASRIDTDEVDEYDVYVCPWCGEDYPTLRALRRHVQDVHRDETMCPVCCVRFQTPLSLQIHVTRRAGMGDKPHIALAYLLARSNQRYRRYRDVIEEIIKRGEHGAVDACEEVEEYKKPRTQASATSVTVKLLRHSALTEMIGLVRPSSYVLRGGAALLAALTNCCEVGDVDREALRGAIKQLTGRDVNVDELLEKIRSILYHNE